MRIQTWVEGDVNTIWTNLAFLFLSKLNQNITVVYVHFSNESNTSCPICTTILFLSLFMIDTWTAKCSTKLENLIHLYFSNVVNVMLPAFYEDSDSCRESKVWQYFSTSCNIKLGPSRCDSFLVQPHHT